MEPPAPPEHTLLHGAAKLSGGGGGLQSGQDQVSAGRVWTCGTHTAASENTPPAGFHATVGNILGGEEPVSQRGDWQVWDQPK